MKKFFMSFIYAFKGIIVAARQRNFIFHIIFGISTVVLGFYFGITKTEWMIVVLAVGVILMAESFNTASEEQANIMRDVLHAPYEIMGKTKDLAAGAVLLAAISVAVVGIMIFLPYFLALL